MAPTELVTQPQSGPKSRLTSRATWRAHLVSGVAIGIVNLTTTVYAQDAPPDQPPEEAAREKSVEAMPTEPTVGEAVGEAVATERGPGQAAQEGPEGDRVEQAPRAPAAVSSARSMFDAVRAAASRQLIPAPTPEELRQRTLDTSFPAEQPHLDVTEPPREVVVAPVGPNAPREPSRRTVVRVIDGVTVLTNVTEGADDGGAVRASATPPRSAVPTALDAPQDPVVVAVAPREVAVNSNALSPAAKSESSAGLGVWLWALAGFAVLLLVPIGVLLTRPVRRG